MAAYISFQPSDFYNTKLYTGDGSASRSLTGVGFQPDFTWIKPRSTTVEHNLYDSPRGATWALQSNNAEAQGQNNGYGWLSAFGADGFTVVEGGSNASRVNNDTVTYASWNWKAGTTTGIAGSPSITPTTYSFNATSGFSIIKYVGNGVAGATIPHGLGAVPHFAIFKYLDGAEAWGVYHHSIGNGKKLVLNTDESQVTQSTIWNDTSPTSTLFSIGTHANVNTNTINYIAYIFTEKTGYSKFGAYTGNANANGPFIYTGFRPAFVMIKNVNAVQAWNTFDDKRSNSGYNMVNKMLQPNDASVEVSSTDGIKSIDLVSNGFKIRGLNNEINKTGDTLVYAAFAEFPFVSSNSKAGVAR